MILMITMVIFSIFILFHTLYIFIPLYSSRAKKKSYPLLEKGMTIIIPAYNEELVIENCLRGIFNLNYKDKEVLFINDGSTDDTLETLNEHLLLKKTSRDKLGVLKHKNIRGVYRSQKYPTIWVVDKENGGKADALNTGIEFAKKGIVITLDADSILEPNSLNEMNRTFSDESVVAAGGLVNIVQGFKHSGEKLTPFFKLPGIIRYQIVQYLTSFYMHKVTQSKFGSITVIAGAFGAFRRNILIEAKGYRITVGEDMDITLKIQQIIGNLQCKRIVFVPDAICYTECPANFKNLYKQRIRWQKAFVDCVITHRRSLFRKMNFRVSTYLLLDSLFLGTICSYSTLLVPIIVIITLNHVKLSIILYIMSIALAMMQDIATLLVSRRFGHLYRPRDLISFILFLPIEVIFYRITGLLFVSIGTILYFMNKESWSRSERVGQPIMLDG